MHRKFNELSIVLVFSETSNENPKHLYVLSLEEIRYNYVYIVHTCD